MEYLILIYADENNRPPPSEEGLQRWFSYTDQLKEAGVFVAGEPLMPVATAQSFRRREGSMLSTDGPFAETKEQLGGFYMIRCETEEQARHWAAECPVTEWGTAELRPILKFD